MTSVVRLAAITSDIIVPPQPPLLRPVPPPTPTLPTHQPKVLLGVPIFAIGISKYIEVMLHSKHKAKLEQQESDFKSKLDVDGADWDANMTLLNNISSHATTQEDGADGITAEQFL